MIRLNVKKMKEKHEAHAYLRRRLGFPEYYGCNLDALYDCLTQADPMELSFKNLGEENGYFDRMLPVFEDACEANRGLTLSGLAAKEAE